MIGFLDFITQVVLKNTYPYRIDKVVTMFFYNLVTTLYFETVATLLVLQGSGKAVTQALSQPCI